MSKEDLTKADTLRFWVPQTEELILPYVNWEVVNPESDMNLIDVDFNLQSPNVKDYNGLFEQEPFNFQYWVGIVSVPQDTVEAAESNIKVSNCKLFQTNVYQVVDRWLKTNFKALNIGKSTSTTIKGMLKGTYSWNPYPQKTVMYEVSN